MTKCIDCNGLFEESFKRYDIGKLARTLARNIRKGGAMIDIIPSLTAKILAHGEIKNPNSAKSLASNIAINLLFYI